MLVYEYNTSLFGSDSPVDKITAWKRLQVIFSTSLPV